MPTVKLVASYALLRTIVHKIRLPLRNPPNRWIKRGILRGFQQGHGPDRRAKKQTLGLGLMYRGAQAPLKAVRHDRNEHIAHYGRTMKNGAGLDLEGRRPTAAFQRALPPFLPITPLVFPGWSCH